MRADLHAHTTYSDGSPLPEMCRAAEAAGLDAVGFTDHLIVVDDDFGRRERYHLVETYERRREAIERFRPRTDLTVWDAAEVSYVADAEAETADFLASAGFDYTIGSVHFAGEYDYTTAAGYADASEAERRAAVERYVDAVVAAVESELFDVLGHLDLPERMAPLRGHARRSDYERVAVALSDSATVPEINAGRVHDSLGRVHPDPAMLDAFLERDVSFVLGTDSHSPSESERRVPALRDAAVERDVPLADFEPAVGR
ncbi:PHP domain-containing protein [Halosimplex carlsbadense 2-9-1]|uniref:histidinol-phosphatase n=1 Tax=Halosimplex carlsbadense 2-9-1 TaxID=797114 RepID=M0D391_9EURY|nr:PHP domain-containing protein [Halosimplex carlsbadense]ELZ29157.1 PHP domain-containing protein [Halosimplex carlsbadense 2-9-1]